jgi:hypothetical protein
MFVAMFDIFAGRGIETTANQRDRKTGVYG